MKKLLTIIGARPQIIKAAALNRAIYSKFQNQLSEVIVHTGQHYDHGMSEVFFKEMGIPKPDYNLEIGSSSHGAQTGKMLEEIEKVILQEKPDALVVYGDTNSTLAGALSAVKLHLPVIHIEAGLRSFNKRMPEEVNRIVADHSSTLLFSPTLSGVNNLEQEGFRSLADAMTVGSADLDNPYVFHCGDLMYDNTIYYGTKATEKSELFEKHGIDRDNFILSTIHRPQNTDNPAVLLGILSSVNEISLQEQVQVVLPLHPRTANIISNSVDPRFENLKEHSLLKIIDPVGFLEMILLEKHASLIMTDSGGVQKEAFFMKKPCVILRPETEWIEIVDNGCAVLAGSNPERIKAGYEHFKNQTALDFPVIFGEGKAAEFICESIIEHIN
ncbi:MAG: UDP-N-acetylglucosamine 2-epimerase (non-hydrolyzing) [Flavobacteriales bacterium]|nr:UDP-N-acetylglucosamine 2-epimerase (non-hydrolyzing) [Flavobacteriales bacterium]